MKPRFHLALMCMHHMDAHCWGCPLVIQIYHWYPLVHYIARAAVGFLIIFLIVAFGVLKMVVSSGYYRTQKEDNCFLNLIWNIDLSVIVVKLENSSRKPICICKVI